MPARLTQAAALGMSGRVADTDPFADTAFVTRLQKLLPMLASEQPGEADAARRKLLEHLGHHRLSLTDVALRLPAGARGASFTGGAREMSLERQLNIARISRQEAQSDTQRAMMQVADLRQALQQAAFELGRAVAAQARARLVAVVGWLMVAVVGCLAVAEHLHIEGMAQGEAVVAGERRMLRPELLPADESSLHLAPGERFGTVLVQDLAIRLSPNEDAGVRAFLNRGMRVVVEQQVRMGTQNWLLVRSVTGSGWVRGGDVLR